MANRVVAVDLIARIRNYVPNVKAAGQATKDLRGELTNLRKNNQAVWGDLERNAAIAGAALAGLGLWAVKVAATFDKQMSEVQAITGETAEGMDALRKAALAAGKATAYSATEAAAAEAELAKAGLSTADILGGALDGALSLAAAGSLELADAASIAAKTMGQFGLQGSDVAHIADLLAGGANATATDVKELGDALAMGGLAANAAGLDIEQTTTILSAFAKGALTGSDAGTSLKSMLMMLQAPSEKARGLMEKYSLSVYDANGNMIDAYALAGELQSSFGSLSQEERNAALATIFGADAMRAANILYQQGASGLKDVNKQLLAQADAARVAGIKQDNLSGDIEKLKGSLETLFITSGEGAMGPLRIIVQSLDHLVNTFGELPEPVQIAISGFATLTGATLLGAAATMKMTSMVSDTVAAMSTAGPKTAAMARGFQAMATTAGRAAVSLIVITTALTLLGEVVDLSAIGFGDADTMLKELNSSAARHAREAARAAQNDKTLAKNMAEVVDEGRSLVDIWNELHGTMKNADEAALDANKAIEAVADSFEKNGKKVKGNTTAALENRVALENSAEAAAKATQAYLDNGGTVGGAQKKMNDYKKAAEDAAVANGADREQVHLLVEELYRLPESKMIDVNINLRFGGGTPAQIRAKLNNMQLAHGGIVETFAGGGESHVAQIAPAGSWRVWGEPETGGEAYIPLANDRRARSMSVLADVARRFNVPLGGGGGGGNRTITVVVKDTSGRVLRREMINDALDRGIHQTTVSAAYP